MQEDDHLHHHHLERPSVLEYEPVALRGEDGSDTGWERRGEYRNSNLQVGRGDCLENTYFHLQAGQK